MRLHPLFAPNDAPAGGAVETPDKSVIDGLTDKGSPTLNLDSTVKLGGKEYKLADLATLPGEIEKLKSQLDGAAGVTELTKKIVAGQATVEDHKALMSKLGYTPEQVAEYVKEHVEPAEAEGKAKKGEPSELEQTVAQLREELAAVKGGLTTARQNTGERLIEEAAMSALKADPIISELMARRKEVDAKFDEDTFLKQWKPNIRDAGIRKLRATLAKNPAAGFDEALIAPAIKEAVTEFAAQAKALIGDVEMVGRTPQMVAEAARLRNQKPVDLPKFDPAKHKDGAEDPVDAFLNDRLQRLSRESGGRAI